LNNTVYSKTASWKPTPHISGWLYGCRLYKKDLTFKHLKLKTIWVLTQWKIWKIILLPLSSAQKF